MKKRIAALLLTVMVILTSVLSTGTVASAESNTNLKMEDDTLQNVQVAAGAKIHMKLELTVKKGWCSGPVFSVQAEGTDSPLKIDSVKLSDPNNSNNQYPFLNTTTPLVLEYDITVDEYATIGTYKYYITYSDPLSIDEASVNPGKLEMEVSVVAEKTPPQIAVISDTEFSVKAGEEITLKFTVRNEGEIKALNTYVSVDAGAYNTILIPTFSPLKQKIGDIAPQGTKEVTISYKVDKDAQSQRIVLPIQMECKKVTGAEVPQTSVYYLYINVEGKKETASTEEPSTLVLNTVKQSPASPKAGENLKVTFLLQNLGKTDVTDVKISMTGLSSHGFEPLDSEPYQYIGTIAAGSSRQVEVNVKVGKDISEGLNTLNIQYSYTDVFGSVNSNNSEALNILNVQNKKEEEGSALVLNTVKQSPASPKAGENLKVTFLLQNLGKTDVTDVKVSLTGLSSHGFEPLDSEPYQYIGTIAAGSSRQIEVNVKVGKDISEGLNALNIQYSYTDALGSVNSNSETLNILNVQNKKEEEITPTPEPSTLVLNTVKQTPESPKAGENLKVTFRLQNLGKTDVTDVKVSLTGLSSHGFEPLDSEPYQYIGTIAAGSSRQIEVIVKVGKDIPEGLNALNIQYSYTDVLERANIENVALNILNVQNKKAEEETTISRPKLMISNFYTDLDEVKAGSIFDFTFELLNTNDEITAKNIKVTVTSSSGTFSVTAGGNSFFVREIKPGEVAPITINLKASAAATTSAYPINIKMEYEYEGMVATSSYSGEIVEEQVLLQVKENLRPSVENVYVGGWQTPIINQATAMNFEFYNMGKSTLNNTYVTIEGDFMLSNGSNTYYIGNIAAGMPEYVEFDVIPLVEGNAVGKMVIHMEDSNGEEVTMEKEFTAYIMGEQSWEDPGNSGFEPYIPTDVDPVEVKEPIVPLWIFLCIQAGILVVVIPVTRKLCLAVYRRKVKKEDEL
ncbi:MAG: COG1361 S-layer family protein [Lachnospiraceae bacterium]